MRAGCLWEAVPGVLVVIANSMPVTRMRAWRSELFVSCILFTETKNASKTCRFHMFSCVVMHYRALPSLLDLLTLGRAVF